MTVFAGVVGVPEINPVVVLKLKPESVSAGEIVKLLIAPPVDVMAKPPIAVPTTAFPALEERVNAGGAN